MDNNPPTEYKPPFWLLFKPPENMYVDFTSMLSYVGAKLEASIRSWSEECGLVLWTQEMHVINSWLGSNTKYHGVAIVSLIFMYKTLLIPYDSWL